ncbi:hypothetical protein CISIN_1g046657mg [Citrus sinensis]|uniref:Uncharacterized protein n=1 Tax=Citrus sinensis TaxID=2711 RepID=A0A067EVH7_CITSI|nr:hypothetical protein CISIN_1g046657mg [Citrus sinensis]
MSYYNQNQPPVGVPPQQGPRILQFIQVVYLVILQRDIRRTLILHRDILLSRDTPRVVAILHNKDTLRRVATRLLSTLLNTASLRLRNKNKALVASKDVWLPCAAAACWMLASDKQ